MPNIGAILKDEISRLCRREIRKQVQPVRKVSAGYRRDIAALKRQVQDLQRRTSALAKRAVQAGGNNDKAGEPARASRFVAKGLRSLRSRLGLSASDLARLMSVSDQSIYNWELKKTTPRKEQLATLAGIRSLGKREAHARLEQIGSRRKKKAGRKAR